MKGMEAAAVKNPDKPLEAQRAMQAMMNMVKLDIAKLKASAKGKYKQPPK
jgi:hypothetical protein